MADRSPAVRATSDHSLCLVLGEGIDTVTLERVRRVFLALQAADLQGVTNLHPAYASLLVSFDPRRTDRRTLAAAVTESLERAERLELPPSRLVEIPVTYGGAHGPDLEAVARHSGLPAEEVVGRHSRADYLVHFLGFSPGFAYLGGLPPELATPRLATPRPRVPAGSVAIGGAQTGVYPQASPGGWHLIGRTPLILFDPSRTPPTRLELGDRVKLHPLAAGIEVEASAPPAEVAAACGARPLAEVLHPGLLSSVQDLGRPGYAHLGVGTGGAADPVSFRFANLQVGNPAGLAAIEMTLRGCILRFVANAVVALTGAELHGHLDGRAFPAWQPVAVRPGQVLELGAMHTGARAYLAARGGIAVPSTLGSASTHITAGFGGLGGRGLRTGDLLHAGHTPPTSRRRARAPTAKQRQALLAVGSLRVLPGAHAAHSGVEALAALTSRTFTVSSRSDRAGVRLVGEPVADATATLLTEGMPTGAVQIPPDGQPIIMLADHPTTGGYPQLATVIAADLHRLGQLRPGQAVRLTLVEPSDASRALAELEELLAAWSAGGLR